MTAGVRGRAEVSAPVVCVLVAGSEQEACRGGSGMCLHRGYNYLIPKERALEGVGPFG